jgi:hypothetical protein
MPARSALRSIVRCALLLGAGMWVGVPANAAAGVAAAGANAGQADGAARQDARAPAADTLPLEQYARLPVCSLSADGRRLAVEPCRTAPTRQPKARRAVTAILPAMPARPVPRTAVAPPLPPSPPLRQAPRPVPVTACDAGGCYDAAGVRHTGAGGNATISPSGQLCLRDGVWLQCQ